MSNLENFPQGKKLVEAQEKSLERRKLMQRLDEAQEIWNKAREARANGDHDRAESLEVRSNEIVDQVDRDAEKSDVLSIEDVRERWWLLKSRRS